MSKKGILKVACIAGGAAVGAAGGYVLNKQIAKHLAPDDDTAHALPGDLDAEADKLDADPTAVFTAPVAAAATPAAPVQF